MLPARIIPIFVPAHTASMKKTIISLLTIVLCATLSAQPIANKPLVQNPDTLRILAVGNSFSDDGTMYLPDLLEGANIHNVIIARLYIGGCSLERHCKEYRENLHNYRYSKSTENKWVTVKEEASLTDGLCDEPWDIVTIQQSSPLSGFWESHQPWMHELIGIIRERCTNPEATIVWHQTWAYASNSDHKNFPDYDRDQSKMYLMICDCLSRIQDSEDLPVVIPCGNTIQALRSTRISTEKELTRDGYHLDYRHGRYAAACTWFEALVEPTLGVSVKKSKARLEDTENEISQKDAKLCCKWAAKTVKELSK